jgi:hypothetical protein
VECKHASICFSDPKGLIDTSNPFQAAYGGQGQGTVYLSALCTYPISAPPVAAPTTTPAPATVLNARRRDISFPASRIFHRIANGLQYFPVVCGASDCGLQVSRTARVECAREPPPSRPRVCVHACMCVRASVCVRTGVLNSDLCGAGDHC